MKLTGEVPVGLAWPAALLTVTLGRVLTIWLEPVAALLSQAALPRNSAVTAWLPTGSVAVEKSA
ncbi:hypothetical protein [Mesorhizobium amorphae]|uniref:hypothetical protein n=1 Tax=Mesorhizobium amorphae TaxID=71433 RepID=UPI001181DD26|nr:hypothetical protein [Mesorhizobium amorphae]